MAGALRRSRGVPGGDTIKAEMDGSSGEGRVNSFALVSYLPELLGSFVDTLRRELCPADQARAHITVLPPRPLTCLPESAWAELQNQLGEVGPFQIELQQVELFRASDVIYISIGDGYDSLQGLHRLVNAGYCDFTEAWSYQPHVTLGQQLDPGRLAPSLETARRRWREFAGPRSFTLDHLTWVQYTAQGRWLDLAQWELRPPVPA